VLSKTQALPLLGGLCRRVIFSDDALRCGVGVSKLAFPWYERGDVRAPDRPASGRPDSGPSRWQMTWRTGLAHPDLCQRWSCLVGRTERERGGRCTRRLSLDEAAEG
jgi:hypothetical protein